MAKKMTEKFQRLVDCYRFYPGCSDELKVASLAQWILESGWGTSKLALEHSNFGGLKWRKEMLGSATPVNYLAHDGKEPYCKFEGVYEFILGYWKFLGRSPYKGWENHTKTAQEFLRFIGPIYCPTPGYVAKVESLFDEARALLRLSAPQK